MRKTKAIGVLKKVYHHENADYEKTYFGKVGRKTEFLTDSQKALLEDANLVPNDFKEFTHDELIEGFLEIKGRGKVTLDLCTALFIKGLSGDVPRYRQSLMSYWHMNGLSRHSFETSSNRTTCAICDLPDETVLDRTHALLTYYYGHSWNEGCADFLLELEEISEVEKPNLTDDDRERFITLLQEIATAETGETPGLLEKRIGKLKLLPKTDKYKRYGILQTLAVIGVLPSDEGMNNQPARSDIVAPLAGWRGELGVDFDKAFEIFEIKAQSAK
ncbi:MAG: hypothetical protein ABJN69_08055 [Hellea sp.]